MHVAVRCCAAIENHDQKSTRMTHSATQFNLIAPSRDRLDDLSGTASATAERNLTPEV
jgi:hypothetical protein